MSGHGKVATILLFTLVVSGAAAAGEPPLPAPPADPPEETEEVSGGWVVHLDPETREFLPEAPPDRVGWLAKALAAGRQRSSIGLQPFPLLGGGRGVFLDGRYQTALVAHAQEDGSFAIRCGSGPAEPPLAVLPVASSAPEPWEEK